MEYLQIEDRLWMYIWIRMEFTYTLNPVNGWKILVYGPWFKNCYTIVSTMIIIWIAYTNHAIWYEGVYAVKVNLVPNRLMLEDEIEHKNTSD